MAHLNYFRGRFVRNFSSLLQIKDLITNAPQKPKEHSRKKEEWNENYEVRKYVNRHDKKMKYEEAIPFETKNTFRAHKLREKLTYRGLLRKSIEEKETELFNLHHHFLVKRVDVLGPDLAAATFILTRGGSVKFLNHENWISLDKEDVCIPRTYEPGYYVEGINTSGMSLPHVGLECLYELKKLKTLSLRGQTDMSNFSLDLISGRYGNQIEHLDLSGCKEIDHYGLACMYRFKNLKLLELSDMNHTIEFKQSCLLLLELLPDLNIKGVDLSLDVGEKPKMIEDEKYMAIEGTNK